MKHQYNNKLWTAAIAVLIILVAVLPAIAGKKPLKIVILAGQSNMQEPAGWQTLKGLADSPATKPLYDKLVDENGRVRVHKDVHIAYLQYGKDAEGNKTETSAAGGPIPRGFGGKVLGTELNPKPKKGEDVKRVLANYGPELGFGVTLHEELQEPILIIKAAWGGKSLCYDFRPPNGKEWTPPKGHPDHPDSAPPPIPIPKSIELPKDFQPPKVRGKHLAIAKGWPIGEINGVHPIYVISAYDKKGGLTDIPLKKGDLIIGLNGEGLGENPVLRWRDLWFNKTREGDWKIKVTVWRPSTSKVETFEIDTALTLEGGRAAIPAYLAAKKAARKKLLNEGGKYYWKMLKHIKTVLADPGKYHPAYDPKQGYEIAGFVWFQGFNDKIASTTYPNGDKPRGFEQYSWLLASLIRHVRKELKTPNLPFVIGVFGQGGKVDKPVPFRECMAAPASYPEFKGTVAAVRTAPFWDSRIEEIKNKLDRVMAYKGGDPNHPYAKLQAKIKAYKEQKMAEASKLTGKARRRMEGTIKRGIVEVVRTPEETEYLKNNVSNHGFHYNGSPKFFVRAGAAFAKALSGMIKDSHQLGSRKVIK